MVYDDPCEGVVCNIPGETCQNGICKCGSACSCEGSQTGSYCDAKIAFVNVRKWKMLARMVRFVILSLDVALDKPESA